MIEFAQFVFGFFWGVILIFLIAAIVPVSIFVVLVGIQIVGEGVEKLWKVFK